MSQDDSDQLRVTFPSSEEKIILGPFRAVTEVSNHEFDLQEDLYSALLSRSDLDLEFKYYWSRSKNQESAPWLPGTCVSVNKTPLTVEEYSAKPVYLKTVCRPGINVMQITVLDRFSVSSVDCADTIKFPN